jgi:hypothetical protein
MSGFGGGLPNTCLSICHCGIRIERSNLSFTATFSKRKPLIFLEKVGGLWFLASEKRPYGTEMGLVRCFGAKIAASKLALDFVI